MFLIVQLVILILVFCMLAYGFGGPDRPKNK